MTHALILTLLQAMSGGGCMRVYPNGTALVVEYARSTPHMVSLAIRSADGESEPASYLFVNVGGKPVCALAAGGMVNSASLNKYETILQSERLPIGEDEVGEILTGRGASQELLDLGVESYVDAQGVRQFVITSGHQMRAAAKAALRAAQSQLRAAQARPQSTNHPK